MTASNALFYSERLGVVIDGPAFYALSKAADVDVDFRKVHTYFNKRGHLMRIVYFTMLWEIEEDGKTKVPMMPLVDFLSFNGFLVKTKYTREYDDPTRTSGVKSVGNFEVDLTVEAVKLARAGAQHIVLFIGNGHYTSLVALLQDMGARVTVCSSVKDGNSQIADSLRRQADGFIEFSEFAPQVEKSA